MGQAVNRQSQQSTELFEPREVSDLDVSGNGDLLNTGRSERSYDRTQVLWNARGFLARCAGVGLVVFILMAFIIPPKFESTTRLMPPDNSSEGLGMLAMLASKGSGGDSSLGDLAGDVLGVKNSGALFVAVLHSRTVEDNIIQRFDLRKLYGYRTWEATRKELESRTVIWEDRKSGVIETRVRDRSPARAQALARAYVEELDRAVTKLSTSAARREREFLETRLAGVKKDLDQASRDFSQFASRNTAIDIPAQGKAMVESAAVLQGQLMAAEAEEEGLKQIYTANNIRVRSLEGRIDELRHQLDLIGKAGTGSDSQSGSELDDGLFPSIRKIPLLGVTYFDLFRRAKIQEALYEALTKRYEMAKVQEAKEIPTVRVLDPADLPEKKISPQRTLIVFLGLMSSLALGCAWVLGSARWRQLDSHDDPRKAFILRATADVKHDWRRLRGAVARFSAKANSDSKVE
jgi:capsule polysaccharide export protein KpsE/RkpR